MQILKFTGMFFILLGLYGCDPGKKNVQVKDDYLVLKMNDTSFMYAYYNKKGEKVLGDYAMAFADTLKDFAIVADSGYILIDKQGKPIYHIFTLDNGPDETKEGLYRIMEDGKIGFVDSATSKLVIPPAYAGAWPFENGKAKVSFNCITITDGEHSSWVSGDWFYIDKQGNTVK